MAGDDREGLGLDDDGRLPWLEPADAYEGEGEVSPTRLLIMALGGVLLIGALLGSLWWIQNGGSRERGELILAQEGDYKIPPSDDAAKTFEGEGDVSFAASEGAEPAGRVDPSRMPEEPAVVAAARPEDKPAPASSEPARAPVTSKSDEPASAASPAAGSTGGQVQLGAFSSEAAANKAWTNLSKRFSYLADLNRSVSPAKVGDGTVYRLRVSTGSAGNASSLCGKLRVAGENCVIVR